MVTSPFLYIKYHSVWRDVEEFWFSFHSTFIESLKNIDNLRKVLGFSDNSNDHEAKYKTGETITLNESLTLYVISYTTNTLIIETSNLKNLFNDKQKKKTDALTIDGLKPVKNIYKHKNNTTTI